MGARIRVAQADQAEAVSLAVVVALPVHLLVLAARVAQETAAQIQRVVAVAVGVALVRAVCPLPLPF
jgi:hypothetical protein